MAYGQGRTGVAEGAAVRTVLLTSADTDFRHRLSKQLTSMRWQVREAGGGAEAIALLETLPAEALLLDTLLPDLEVSEFARQVRTQYPEMDLLRLDGGVEELGAKSPRRNELLYAIRQAQAEGPHHAPAGAPSQAWKLKTHQPAPELPRGPETQPASSGQAEAATAGLRGRRPVEALPDMVGDSAAMLEMARLVRLVAPQSATVLLEGETGTGKELVAKAVCRLSRRAAKPFMVLNCAAIPEALLEAELFGHTRGAFTGAVQSRMGRIEAANGGTLFLDEIGEMPLPLQAKMLRFLESGELQRVGDNETLRVDVRVIAATHQHLEQRVTERAFRLDLYHRLAVFPIKLPALRKRMEDVLPLARYLLDRMGEAMPVKRLSSPAAQRLMEHNWPGNVRELAHVLERATILSEDRREIARDEIRL